MITIIIINICLKRSMLTNTTDQHFNCIIWLIFKCSISIRADNTNIKLDLSKWRQCYYSQLQII